MTHVAPRLVFALTAFFLLAPLVAADGPVPPDAPAWIDATYQNTNHAILLTWGQVESATSYNLYRNGDLIATLLTPSYLDSNLPLDAITYRVTAVAEDVESLPATATVAQAPLIGTTALLVAPGGDPFVSLHVLSLQSCEPIHGSGDIDWDCIQHIIHYP